MNLSIAQKATFLTWLNTNASALNEQQAADLANTIAAPSYFTWLKTADKAVIDGLIVKANYTPADAVPTADVLTNAIWQARAFACQLKQTNAQWLTTGASLLDARQPGVRQNFQDCMKQLPSGAGGAIQEAGWGTVSVPGPVRLAMMRTVTNFEKLYVAVAVPGAAGAGNVITDARGANTNPDILGMGTDGNEIVGPVTAQNVSDIRGGL